MPAYVPYVLQTSASKFGPHYNGAWSIAFLREITPSPKLSLYFHN